MRFLVGFVAVCGVLSAGASLDPTGAAGPVVLLAVLATALVVERLLHDVAPGDALRRLGFVSPDGRVLAVAGAVSVAVLVAFPLFTAVTGAGIGLRPNWPWLVLGVFALHGLAEEVVWRGYVFRRLRARRSFRSAVVASVPFVAVAHVPIVVTSGWAVGGAALLVAAVTAVPLSHLFEAGRGSVWAPALVHAAIDSFKLVEVPAAALAFSLTVAAVALLVPLLALLVPRRWNGRAPAPVRGGRAPGPARRRRSGCRRRACGTGSSRSPSRC